MQSNQSLADVVMNKYEITKVVSARIQQVCGGGPLFVTRGDNESIPDAVQRELLERKTPLKIVRHMPDGSERIYDVKDMVVREDLLMATGHRV